MGIIVEVVSRSHKVLERHKFSGSRLTLGRAYDNNIILTEPHVSPYHAVIQKLENGLWVISDAGSQNGLYTQRHKRIYDSHVIHSGEIFTLGKLQIRFLSLDHPVADTLALNPVETVISALSKPAVTLVILTGAALLFILFHYAGLYSVFEVKPLINEVIVFALVCLGWASAWAFTGRLLKHDARFFAQLSIVALYLVCEAILQAGVEFLKFNSSSEFLGVSIYVLVDWFLLGFLLWFNLYIATGLTQRQRRLTSGSIAMAIIALSLFFEYFQENRFSLKPSYVNILKPPPFYLGQPVTTEYFLRDSEAVFVRNSAD